MSDSLINPPDAQRPAQETFLTEPNHVLTLCLNWLAILTMTLLVLDVMWGVLTRYVGGQQAKWTEELASFLLIWVSLLGGATAFRAKEHLGIDLLVTHWEPSVRKSVKFFTECITFFVVLWVLVYGGICLVVNALLQQQTTPALGWKMGFVYLIVPLVGGLMLLFSSEFVLRLWRTPPEDLLAGIETPLTGQTAATTNPLPAHDEPSARPTIEDREEA